MFRISRRHSSVDGRKGAGDHALPDELEKSLRILNPDWVQVDSKGHPGVTSFFSKVPDAAVCDTLSHDAESILRAVNPMKTKSRIIFNEQEETR